MSPSSSVLDSVPLPEMDASPNGDQRSSPRVYCRVPVRLQTVEGYEVAATCLDVNRNGIGIECDRVLTVGQRLHLVVPNGKPGASSRVPMLVIYRMEKHYGLSALGAHEDVLNLLPSQA